MKKFILLALLICFPFKAMAETKVIQVNVALCDNFYQRIYPVPPKLGNGSDPENNLYWGAMYGIKTYFKNSKDWIFVEEKKDINSKVLRRAIFKHKNTDTWVVADAYMGKKIKKSTEDYFEYLAGNKPRVVNVKYKGKDITLNAGGKANLVAYVGHDGLMDFDLDIYPTPSNKIKREAIVLACYSKRFFADGIKTTGATPILLTNGKMAPEGYVLEAALSAWIKKQDVRDAVATAYAKYQKISKKAGLGLFSKN